MRFVVLRYSGYVFEQRNANIQPAAAAYSNLCHNRGRCGGKWLLPLHPEGFLPVNAMIITRLSASCRF